MVLELVPVARDLIHIRGVHTGFYLALNKYGEVYTTVSYVASITSSSIVSELIK